MMLTAEEVRHFRHNGYLVVRHAVPDALLKQTRELVQEHWSPADELSEDGQVKLYRMYERDPGRMHALVAHRGIVEPLRDLLGPNIVYVLNRHNQATVNGPGESRPRLHRDVLQWSRGLVTVIVYLEDATVDNGCTRLVPGSQYLPFFGVPQPEGGGTWMDEHAELRDLADQAVPVPVPAGGILVFDSLVFHSVGLNRSTGTRMSVTAGYRSVDELDATPDATREILVTGELIYRGNDRG
ncbi:phytanoyl-CoA dioxygenase family protein [Actinomadura chibensis]|uniref:Phytanoyl-CoA dioxygenase family protein n=1 Tax=Actinomadura chibensis TaxID=392828 RepID=A0A5D0NU52_9ACTN|nr:phytanoyl-CoA dioxygenase family protein [Actinomadura chibensis]TYB47859.1 phytanoyl-CoA dioxygenase family protein [Actinomadura chibensis]